MIQQSIRLLNKKQSVENHSTESDLSITMMKNKLLKLENNQSTKQVSTTMQDSRIVACNLTLRNLSSTENTKYGTPFLPVHPPGAYFECINTTRF